MKYTDNINNTDSKDNTIDGFCAEDDIDNDAEAENGQDDFAGKYDKIDKLTYSSSDAAKSAFETLFPFTNPKKEKLLGTIAFIVIAMFFAIPGIVSALSYLPFDSFLSRIATQTQNAMSFVFKVAAVVFAWIILGKFTYMVTNHVNPFARYQNVADFIKSNIVKILLIIVLIIMTISSLLCSCDVSNSFSNITDGIFIWYRIFIGCIFAIWLANSKSKHLIRTLMMILVVSALLTSSVMYIQYVTKYYCININQVFSVDMSTLPASYDKIREIRGVFANSNHCGYFLALCTLCAAGLLVTANKWWKMLIWGASFALLINAVVLNNTLGAVLAVVITVVLLPIAFIKSKHKLYARFLPLIVMVGMMGFISSFPSLPTGTTNVSDYVKEVSSMFRTVLGIKSTENPNTQSTEPASEPTISPDEITASSEASEKKPYKEIILDTDQERESIVPKYTPIKDGWWLKNQSLGTSRLGLWQYGIELISRRPWLGYGCNGSADLFRYESGLDYTAVRVHNEYLQVGVDYGIPAMLMYLISILITVIYFFKQLAAGSLSSESRILFLMFVVYCISAFFGIAAYYTVSYFFIVFFLLLGSLEHKALPDLVSDSDNESVLQDKAVELDNKADTVD